MLGISPEPREKKAGNWEKRSDPLVPCPESWRQLWKFLGAVGFCHLWIPRFSVTAGPLYATLKGNPIRPLHWVSDHEHAFQKLKRHLGEALTLVLPDITLFPPLHS
jgi:hypothetical protein